MSTIENPFSAPMAEETALPLTDGSVELAQAERIRQQYIKHEVSLKSIGLLYYLSTFVLGAAALYLMIEGADSPDPLFAFVMMGFCIVFAFVFAVVGSGVRTLASWVKIPVVILSTLGLLNPPIGTLINIYILYLVLSQKGKVVLSPAYKEIIRQTPHIKYTTSIIVKIALVVLVLVLALAVIGALFA